jgi:hypothetical protein
LAQYAQLAQLQGFQNQNQVAQMQMAKMQQNEQYLMRMKEAIIGNGGPADMRRAAQLMATHPSSAEAQATGIQMLRAQDELEAYNKKYNPPAGATGGYGGAPIPSGALGSGTYGITPQAMPAPMQAPMNALAPTAPAPSKNALAVDVNGLQRRLIELSQFPNVPQAKLEASLIQDQLKEASKLHVIPNVGLASGAGQVIIPSGMAPTDIKRLTAERDALPVGDPQRRVYDQAIADIGASNRVAQARLAFDQAKFNWEKANPTKSIHEDASGLLAVDNRTGVATPVIYGATGIQPAPTTPLTSASIMRQPSSGIPNQRIPAIPGMNSVLDQNITPTASPTAMQLPNETGARIPGAPVSGKEKNAPEHFVKTDMQLSGLAGSLKEFKDEIKNNPTTGAKWLPTGADTARMQSKYTSLLMGLKDLYTLGALTGPDMSIIESQITNPASWTGKFTTKKGFEEQTQVVEDMLKRSATNLENSYGRVPKATKKALEVLPSGGGVPNASATNPLGLPGR